MIAACWGRMALVLAIAIVPSVVLAQGMGQGMGMTGQGRGAMLPDPAQLPALKTKLGITAAQTQAWQDYADALTSVVAMRAQMRSSLQGASPAERLEGRAERQAMGGQVHDEVNQKRSALAALMTAGQRQLLDRELPALPSMR
ncbi:Spy/CpxP family protein refolding chaperone [Pararhodospirillum photometricum]|uniref:LTXXQ motif family protein n=1 Tax=Pararhodospirillum photometricum DSM 122 TaxID=1150469 RepID=H6SPW9_PARPM|nr:Spy/CpxP family protein refolding chaperone [Pararhodospirillum photometricum]CCG07239.1 Putative uncharacterized protein [Pararhodospirillum photometricum DSM 122]